MNPARHLTIIRAFANSRRLCRLVFGRRHLERCTICRRLKKRQLRTERALLAAIACLAILGCGGSIGPASDGAITDGISSIDAPDTETQDATADVRVDADCLHCLSSAPRVFDACRNVTLDCMSAEWQQACADAGMVCK